MPYIGREQVSLWQRTMEWKSG